MVDRTYLPRIVGLGQHRFQEWDEHSQPTPGIGYLKEHGLDLPVKPYWFWVFSGQASNALPERPGYARATICDASLVDGWNIIRGSRSSVWFGLRYYEFNLFGTFSSRLENALANKLRAETFNLGVTVGEMQETASLIGGACRTIAQGWRGLVNQARALGKEFVDGARSLGRDRRRVNNPASGWIQTMRDTGRRAVSNYRNTSRNRRRRAAIQADRAQQLPAKLRDAWLQWSYGVKPLMSDVNGMVEAVDRASQRLARQTYRVKLTETLQGSVGIEIAGRPQKGTLSGSLSGVGVVVVSEVNPLLKQADELGINNPLAVAWELVPYSFVVDWFVNVGEWCNGFVPVQGVTFVRGWLKFTLRTTEMLQLSPRYDTSGNPEIMYGTVYTDFKYRVPLGGLPEVSLLAPNLSLSLTQAISGIALLSAGLTW